MSPLLAIGNIYWQNQTKSRNTRFRSLPNPIPQAGSPYLTPHDGLLAGAKPLANEVTPAPVTTSSGIDCRSSPEGQCGWPGMPALGHGAAQAGLGAPYEQTPLIFSHRIDHMQGEFARCAGEICTAERHEVSPAASRNKVHHCGCGNLADEVLLSCRNIM